MHEDLQIGNVRHVTERLHEFIPSLAWTKQQDKGDGGLCVLIHLCRCMKLFNNKLCLSVGKATHLISQLSKCLDAD